MGSRIELNDTLQITTEQGFPKELTLERHLKKPFTAADFKGKVFSFTKPDIRVFHPAPTRVFLAHNIGGKWLYWGHALILEQTIHAEAKTTTGKFVITKVYTPEHQRSMSKYEVDPGKEYLF
jgi:hypothetical protein